MRVQTETAPSQRSAFIFKATRSPLDHRESRRLCTDKCPRVLRECRPWEPTGTPGGFSAYSFCCNCNGKEGVPAPWSSCCRGLRPGGRRGFGDGGPWPVRVCGGWRGSPSSAVWSPLLLGGRVPTPSSLATCWLVANHSRYLGRPGKVETPWRPSPAAGAGSSPPPPLQGGKYLSPEPLSQEQPTVRFVS